MRMSVSPKERNLLIGVLGILIAVAAWFLYISPTRDDIEAIKLENVSLKATADEYESVNLRADEYQSSIAQNLILAEEITGHFPSQVSTQDQMMFWSDIDKFDPDNLRFGDLEIEDRDPVAVAGVDDYGNAQMTVNDDGSVSFADSSIEDISAKYVLYGAPTSMAFACTYDGLKSMVRYINAQNNKNAINGFNVEFDESTGYLEGSVTVELFYIEGLEKEYSPVFIPSVPTGQSNIFHTGERALEAQKTE